VVGAVAREIFAPVAKEIGEEDEGQLRVEEAEVVPNLDE
jgi:hypothetical protein